MLATSVVALMPGHGEMLVLLVIGLLIFGRRLPEVGRALGKTLMQFRRGLQDFKAQIDQDEDLRDVRATVHEIRRATDIPRTVLDPRRLLEQTPEPAAPAVEDERERAPSPRPDPVAGSGSGSSPGAEP